MVTISITNFNVVLATIVGIVTFGLLFIVIFFERNDE